MARQLKEKTLRNLAKKIEAPKTKPEERIEPGVKAFEERCESPRGVRVIVHRTDVYGGAISAAQERSRAFREKYEKQGWRVQVRAVFL